MSNLRISDLIPGTPPYDDTALLELSVPNGASPTGYDTRSAQLSDLVPAGFLPLSGGELSGQLKFDGYFTNTPLEITGESYQVAPDPASIHLWPSINPPSDISHFTAIDTYLTVAGAGNNINEVRGMTIWGDYSTYSGNPSFFTGVVVKDTGGYDNVNRYVGFDVEAVSVGAGITTGLVDTYGLRVGGFTGGAPIGVTMSNRSLYAELPHGSGAGTTNNYGLFLTGNGGSGGAGTTTNWAIYSNSTAPSSLAGNLAVASLRTGTTAPSILGGYTGLNDTTPQSLLDLRNVWTGTSEFDNRIVDLSPDIESIYNHSVLGIRPNVQVPSGLAQSTMLEISPNVLNANTSAFYSVYITPDFEFMSSGSVINSVIGLRSSSYGLGEDEGEANATAYLGVDIQGTNNGNGITSGTVQNWGLRITSHYGGAAAGGTVTSIGAQINLPTSGGAGTNNNYGLYLTGDGSAGENNWAILSESAAPSQLSGLLSIGGAPPAGAAAGTVFANHVVGKFHASNAYYNGGWEYWTSGATANAWVMDGDTTLYCAPAGTAGAAISFTARLVVNNATGACFNTSGSWSAISAAELKQNVQPFTRGLDAVLALNPITFQYKSATPFATQDKPSDLLVGLLASEVEPHIPEMCGVTTVTVENEEREVQTLNPGDLVYVLINSVKTLATRLSELEQRLPH